MVSKESRRRGTAILAVEGFFHGQDARATGVCFIVQHGTQIDTTADPSPIAKSRRKRIVQRVLYRMKQIVLVADQMIVVFGLPKVSASSQQLIGFGGCE